MAVSNTGNKVKRRSRGPQKGGIENYSSLKRLGSKDLYEKQNLLLSHYGLNYQGLRELMTICHNYIDTGSGLNPYAILKIYNKSHGAIQCLYERLTVLKQKELVYSANRLYYPTDKALKELNKLAKTA